MACPPVAWATTNSDPLSLFFDPFFHAEELRYFLKSGPVISGGFSYKFGLWNKPHLMYFGLTFQTAIHMVRVKLQGYRIAVRGTFLLIMSVTLPNVSVVQ